MIDQKTPYLGLPLPHLENLQEDDVPRLRGALELVDEAAEKLDANLTTGLAGVNVKLGTKANVSTVTSNLAKKADKKEVTDALTATENALQSLEQRVQGQITEALNQSTVRALPYADRGQLRTITTAKKGDVAVVRGIGLFDFVPDSVEPDDDQTAFTARGGVWELQALSLDTAYSYIGQEFARQTWLTPVEIIPTVTSVAANATVTVIVDGIVGIEGGEKMLVVPPATADNKILARAYSDYWRRVSLVLANTSTSAVSVSKEPWRVCLIHTEDNHA